jgi:hypothetical protein
VARQSALTVLRAGHFVLATTTSLQTHLSQVEDVVMEENLGSNLSFSALTNVEPVKNMVAIPVLAPGVAVHTLVPIMNDESADIDEEYLPPILYNLNPLQAALCHHSDFFSTFFRPTLHVLFILLFTFLT